MEYCGKIIGRGIEKSRLARMFCSGLALVMIAGTAHDLSASNWCEMGKVYKKFGRPGMVWRHPFIGSELGIEYVCDTTLEGIAEITIPKKRLAESPIRLENNGTDMAAVIQLKEDPILPDEAVTEIHDIVPDTSSATLISEEDEKQIAISTPSVTVPDVPIGENTSDGETVSEELPEELPDGEGGQVNSVQGFLIDDAGMIYDYIPEEIKIDSGYLALPNEGCTGILKGAFEGAGMDICEIDIPANITYIEDGVFADIPELYSIWVGEGNPAYASVDGVLFDSSLTTLAAFPTGWIGIYEVPGSVTRLAGYAFANTKLEKLVMRACCQVEVGEAVFGTGEENGIVISAPWEYMEEFRNMFAGLNVTIE